MAEHTQALPVTSVIHSLLTWFDFIFYLHREAWVECYEHSIRKTVCSTSGLHTCWSQRTEGSSSPMYGVSPPVGSVPLSPVSVWASRLECPSNLQYMAKHWVTFPDWQWRWMRLQECWAQWRAGARWARLILIKAVDPFWDCTLATH